LSIAVGLFFFASAGASSAAEPPGNPVQDVSAVDQYVEALPTSSGPEPTGRGATKRRPLPADVASQVREQGGDDAETLIEIATSPRYAAPSGPDAMPKDPRRLDDQGGAVPNALEAVVSPVAEADERRLLFLLGILGSMTLAAFVLAARQRRP
jgi:hypothetical protein